MPLVTSNRMQIFFWGNIAPLPPLSLSSILLPEVVHVIARVCIIPNILLPHTYNSIHIDMYSIYMYSIHIWAHITICPCTYKHVFVNFYWNGIILHTCEQTTSFTSYHLYLLFYKSVHIKKYTFIYVILCYNFLHAHACIYIYL